MTIGSIIRRKMFAYSGAASEIRAPGELQPLAEAHLRHASTASRGSPSVTPSSYSAPLRLTLFGGPSLVAPGGKLVLSPFQGALLGILASYGQRGIRRGELISLLWSDGSDEVLRPRLNQLIYSIHRRLGEQRAIRLVGEAYMFEEGRVSSDLEGFLTALRYGKLRDAAGVLGLGFLSGLESTPCAAFERWVESQELRFRSDLRTLATDRWREGEQCCDWTMTEEAAEVLLRLGPLDEGALRKLIESRALRGRVREAESTYVEFLEQARFENPDFEPEEETERLLARLSELGRAGMTTRPMISTTTAYDSLPFVGRSEELQRLTDAIRSIPQNGLMFFSVIGEGGIGKTRLVREALARAPFDGVRVLVSRCTESEKRIPLCPLLSSISDAWVSSAINALDAPWRSILLNHLPEHGSHRSPVETPLEEIPRVTCEAFLRLLQHLSEKEPVVLFLDDFQWIDSTSLTVLSYIMKRWSTGTIGIVVTLRESDIETDSGMKSWISGRGRTSTTLRLGPLSQNHLTSLLESSVPEDFEFENGCEQDLYDSIATVAEFAGGHPLLGLECLRSVLADADRVSRMPSVPEGLKQMVGRRIARLSSDGELLVSLLSASDRPLSVGTLREASRLEVDAFTDVLDELSVHQLIRISPSGVAFQHALLRNTVYQSLNAGRRSSFHSRIADALLTEGSPTPIQEIALHLLAAGERRRGLPYVLEAARTSTDAGGWIESRNLLEIGLGSDPTPYERAEIAAQLGRVLMLLGELDDAEARWAEARDAFREVGDEYSELHAQLRILDVQRLRHGADRGAILGAVQALKDEASDRRLGTLVAECLEVEVRLLDGMRRFDDVRSLTSGARTLVASVDVEAKIQLLLVSAVEGVYGNPTGAAAFADQAAELARMNNRMDLLLKALNWKIIALGHLGRLSLRSCSELIEQASELAKSTRNPEQACLFHLNLGVWNIDAGSNALASRCLARAEDCLRGIAAPDLRRSLLINRGHLALEIDEPQEAEELFARSLKVSEAQDYPPAIVTAHAGTGLALLAQGRIAEAKRVQTLMPARPQNWSFDPFLWISFETRLAVLLERTERAALSIELEEKRVREGIALAWVRLRMLRFELMLKFRISPPKEEIRELRDFLVEAELTIREAELAKLIGRSRYLR